MIVHDTGEMKIKTIRMTFVLNINYKMSSTHNFKHAHIEKNTDLVYGLGKDNQSFVFEDFYSPYTCM